jgi:hypothetical protein
MQELSIFNRNEIPGQESEVPKLSELDPQGRANAVRISPDGIVNKSPVNSKELLVTEEQVITEFQDWQKRALAFLRTEEGTAFIAQHGQGINRNYMSEIENIIFLGEKELKEGAKRIAHHIESLISEGKQVILANSRPAGASNEYILLHVLEELSLRGISKDKVTVVNPRWVGTQTVEERMRQHISESQSTDHVLLTLDDWRISGKQILVESGDLQVFAKTFFDENPTHTIATEVGLLFEDESRSKDNLNIFAAFSGHWEGGFRQIMSGSWTLVDYGFQDREDLKALSKKIERPLPMAFSIIRPTEVLPTQLGSKQPLVYRDEPLRSRALAMFSKWATLDDAIPEKTRDQIRIFEAAQEAKSWEELQVHSLNDLETCFSAMDSEHPIIQKLSEELDERISSERARYPIPLYQQDAVFVDETNDLARALVTEALKEKGFNETEVSQLLPNIKMTIDRVIRLVAERRHTEIPSTSSIGAYTVVEQDRKSYFCIDFDKLGSEVLSAHEIVIDESTQPIQALLVFDHYTQRIPDTKKSAFPLIVISSRHVSVFFPRNYENFTEVAKRLFEKGFGEQFVYSWYRTDKPTVYLSPQEYISSASGV